MHRIDFYKLYVVYKNKKILTVENKNKPCLEERLSNKHKKQKEKKQQNIDKYQNKNKKHINQNKKYLLKIISSLQEGQHIIKQLIIQKLTITTRI